MIFICIVYRVGAEAQADIGKLIQYMCVCSLWLRVRERQRKVASMQHITQQSQPHFCHAVNPNKWKMRKMYEITKCRVTSDQRPFQSDRSSSQEMCGILYGLLNRKWMCPNVSCVVFRCHYIRSPCHRMSAGCSKYFGGKLCCRNARSKKKKKSVNSVNE